MAHFIRTYNYLKILFPILNHLLTYLLTFHLICNWYAYIYFVFPVNNIFFHHKLNVPLIFTCPLVKNAGTWNCLFSQILVGSLVWGHSTCNNRRTTFTQKTLKGEDRFSGQDIDGRINIKRITTCWVHWSVILWTELNAVPLRRRYRTFVFYRRKKSLWPSKQQLSSQNDLNYSCDALRTINWRCVKSKRRQELVKIISRFY